jgi:hypothetical protein
MAKQPKPKTLKVPTGVDCPPVRLESLDEQSWCFKPNAVKLSDDEIRIQTGLLNGTLSPAEAVRRYHCSVATVTKLGQLDQNDDADAKKIQEARDAFRLLREVSHVPR